MRKRRKRAYRIEAKLHEILDRFRTNWRVKFVVAKDLKEYRDATCIPVIGRLDKPLHVDG